MEDNSRRELLKKVDAICEKAWNLRYTNYEALYGLAMEAYTISKDISYEKGISRSTVLIALYNRKNGYPEKFLEKLNNIKQDIEKNDNDYWISRVYCVIGAYYIHGCNYTEALSSYLKAMDRSKNLKDKSLYMTNISDIGTIYIRLGKYEEALKYYNTGIKLNEEYKNINTVFILYINSGEAYIRIKNYEKAIECCKKGLEFIDDQPISEWVCFANNILGSAYRGLGQTEEAIKHYKIAVSIYEIDKSTYSYPYIRAKINLGHTYFGKKDTEKVLEHLKGAMEAAEAVNMNDVLAEIYLLLADVYEELEDYKSEIYYFKKGTELEKRLASKEEELKVHAALLEYNLEQSKRDNEIHRLKNVELKQKSEELEKKANELNLALENLKEAQAQLILSEKMAALGQLIAGIAHEINTPLGAIQASIANINDDVAHMHNDNQKLIEVMSSENALLFFKLINRSAVFDKILAPKEKRSIKKSMIKALEAFGIDDADYAAEMLVDMDVYENIEEFLPILLSKDMQYMLQMAYYFSGLWRNSKNIKLAIGRASNIVFALKNYSHSDNTKEFVKTDIVSNMESVITLYYSQVKQSVELIRNYSEVPAIMCMPDDLTQVWTNLIHNALQAIEYNGKIIIDIHEEAGYINISITDNGKGIPDEIKDKIFEPFFTTKAPGEGTGLGLGITRKIVNQHNGKITFNSVPGCTTFIVMLPLDKVN